MPKEKEEITLETGLSQVTKAHELDGVKVTTAVIKSDNFQEQYDSLSSLVEYLTQLKKAVDAEIKQVILDEYGKTGENSIKTDNYTFSYCSQSMRESVDSKRLKEELPDVYKEYVKVSFVADSIKVRKHKKKEENDKKKEAIEAEYSEIEY